MCSEKGQSDLTSFNHIMKIYANLILLYLFHSIQSYFIIVVFFLVFPLSEVTRGAYKCVRHLLSFYLKLTAAPSDTFNAAS